VAQTVDEEKKVNQPVVQLCFFMVKACGYNGYIYIYTYPLEMGKIV
jgi:hypothetical protein